MDYKVSIEELENKPDKSINFHFEDMIDDIRDAKLLKPVIADLVITSLGEFIEIKGKVQAELELECYLCLNKFNYKMDFDIDEIYAKTSLMDEYSQETELKNNQFVTDLEGKDEIDIYDLLYQSVILNLPNRQVCGINCNGDKFLKDENLSDPRLDVFKNIQINNRNSK